MSARELSPCFDAVDWSAIETSCHIEHTQQRLSSMYIACCSYASLKHILHFRTAAQCGEKYMQTLFDVAGKVTRQTIRDSPLKTIMTSNSCESTW
jgi:hypothetical protein